MPHHRPHERPTATYDQTLQDRRWLDAIAAGNHAAFQATFLHYHPWLLRVAFGLLGNEHDAQEVVQDVMASFWMRRHVVEVRGPLVSYFYVAVKKRAISMIRKRKVADRFTSMWALRPTPSPALEAPDAAMMIDELDTSISEAIARLPRKRREIFLLHRFARMANADIASLLGVSTRTVDTQLHRAYNGLRKTLSPWLPVVEKPDAAKPAEKPDDETRDVE